MGALVQLAQQAMLRCLVHFKLSLEVRGALGDLAAQQQMALLVQLEVMAYKALMVPQVQMASVALAVRQVE
jgi:hypothetical protein